MARLIAEQAERLAAEVSVERLAEGRGVRLVRRGEELVGSCPFHADEADSLVIRPADNHWCCLGDCQAGGSAVEWVMRAEGVSARHAMELLREGVPPRGGLPPRWASSRRLACPFDAESSDAELLDRVAVFYTEALKNAPEALGWLEGRGLRHGELIDTFRLGYANRTLGLRLPPTARKEGKPIRSRLQNLGVLRSSGHEQLRGCVVVPVLDEHGTVTQVYGRRVVRGPERGDAAAAATGDHRWLEGGPARGVWNSAALAAAEVIMCRQVLDALTFWCAGFMNVVAAGGPAGFPDDVAGVFADAGVSRVLIAFARRQAGEDAATALAARLMPAGVECFRVVFPADADANELAAESPSAPEALGRAIRAATWMGTGPAPARRTYPNIPPSEQATPSQRRLKPAGRPRPTVTDEPEPAQPDVVEPDTEPVVAAALPTEGVAPPPVVASPVPGEPARVDAMVAGAELRLRLGGRRWRVRGLERVRSFDTLRVNVLVADDEADRFHIDTLDLYSARARAGFVKAAAEELGCSEEALRRDAGRVLLACEDRAAEIVAAAHAPVDDVVRLSPEEETAAMELLTDPDLIDRVVADFERVGIVGEATNALVGYLAAVSRKLDTPLAVLIQSTTAAGKSALMDAVLGFVPAEERVKFSAVTGQSLFYMGEADLSHKVLAIVEEEGAARASYALKLLQSEGELSIASTGKDPASGRLAARTYRVAGPVAILLTTTAVDVDEELLNRCVVLTVDEDRDQTRAIHQRQRQRQTLEGLLAATERARVVKVHQDAQRLLAPVLVANPFAPRLTFADERTRCRRDHLKYLTLIRAVTLLHQHQRPRRSAVVGGEEVAYIEVTPTDITIANRLAHEVLGRSLDELAPQTRRLLGVLEELVAKGCAASGMERAEFRFTRRDVRAQAGWSDFQVRVHLGRLVELEYVLVHRGGRGHSFVYELLYDGGGADGRPHLIGLTDPATLSGGDYDANIEGTGPRIEGPSSPQRAVIVGGSRGARDGPPPASTRAPRPRVANGRGPAPAQTSARTEGVV
jgi:CHC2-type zinc finger protein/Toprim domain-containing protein